MIDLDDPRWKEMNGGYRLPYDPTPSLRRLDAEGDVGEVWEELWNELHHQGDVGDASYAAVVILAILKKRHPELGWNLYALVSCIEIERHRKANPPVPSWLLPDYEQAWRELLELALLDLKISADPLMVRAALGVVAIAKGATKLGAILSNFDESELVEFLEEQLDWRNLYRDDPAS